MSERGADSVNLDAVADLVAVMDRLRSPGGCPWDAAQTHASLLPHAVEEVFEVVEAVELDDWAALREELGDLLLQVVFHARLAQEHPTEPFGLAEVAAGVAAKLRHRHPHVFGDVVIEDETELHRRWDEIKKAEKSRASALDGIPHGMPGLARAQKVVGRAMRAGLRVAVDGNDLGDRLLALVCEADDAGVDAEGALRVGVRTYEVQVRELEAAAVDADDRRNTSVWRGTG